MLSSVVFSLRCARRSAAYVVELPRDPKAGWKPGAVAYWEHFGDQLGSPAKAVAVPAELGDVQVRAVRLPPAVVLQMTPADLNVVYQRLPLPPGQGFDLVIATNILVYYDIFQQELALANVERMLKPGGILLSNDILLELPGARMRGAGYHTTAAASVFRIDMHGCPSKGFLIRNGLGAYHDYCDHCMGWIGPMLKQAGFLSVDVMYQVGAATIVVARKGV